MKYVFIDFEMNPISRDHASERKLYKQEIIEIGAVMINENHEEISTFKAYVKPLYSQKVTRKVYELTGITDNDLFFAEGIECQLNEFVQWCIETSENDFVVYAWSENDLLQLNAEIAMKSIQVSEQLQSIIDSWKDLQLEYDEVVGSEKPTGLSKALESIGIMFDGKMHDALDDARNTAVLFKEVKDPNQLISTINEIRSYYSGDSKAPSVTLGDIIDFSKFYLLLS